ncbi:MAG: cysteine desulfurase family protein [Parachlamydiaceae bacterium]
MTSLIYLDNSSTARPSDKVINSMTPYWTTHWGLPLSPHQKGQELFPPLMQYYKMLYAFIGAQESDQVILTSSGAEAVNHVVSSVYRNVTMSTGKNHFLASQTDEAPAIMAMSHLEPFGALSQTIEVNSQGIVTQEALADALSPRTALVSCSWANGLTGVVQPVLEIAELCRKRGVLFHLEATHVMGKIFYELEEIKPDFLTFNGDQLHGPRGTGILYIKGGTRYSPLLFGSADQGGMRAGGLNMPGLAGLAAAADEALDHRDLLCTEIARLRNKLEKGIIKGFPKATIPFKTQERLPHCTTLIFPGINNEALLFMLNRRGLCASIGGGNFQQLALILSFSGIEKTLAQSAVGFSLSRYTTEEEIDRAVPIIVESAQMLARLSDNLFLKKDL